MSKEPVVGTQVQLTSGIHERLRLIAEQNKRSLKAHAEWVLIRYVLTQEDDGA